MVKILKDDFKYKEFEYATECSECGVDLKIVDIPKRLKEKSKRENDDYGAIWVSEHYFYCKKCQKDYDYNPMD